jgi:NDP-sugar pyrophosphorylase family protein
VPFGCVERDGDRVTSLEEKPTLEREVNSGIYALDPSVVARVRPGQRVDTPDLIADLLTAGEPVGAFEIEDEWIDVGQREQLAAARGIAT